MASIVKLSLAALALLSPVFADNQVPISASTPSTIPSIGFGTWNLKISSTNTSAAVSAALLVGYRHLDCAAIYGNEIEVGHGIKDGLKEAVLKREDIWITSKLWNDQYVHPNYIPLHWGLTRTGSPSNEGLVWFWVMTHDDRADMNFLAVTSLISWSKRWTRPSAIWAWTI